MLNGPKFGLLAEVRQVKGEPWCSLIDSLIDQDRVF
jgi:hypothetical protein